MEPLIILVVLLLVVVPGAGLALALHNRVESRRQKTRADGLERQLQSLTQQIRTHTQRIYRLERTPGDRRVEEPPAVAERKAPAAPAEPRPTPPTPRPAPSPSVIEPPARIPAIPSESGQPGLERHLGTRVSVWLGAIAFSLAGAFLVKYTLDRDLLGPTARVALGLVFGAALLGTGEWMRSRMAQLAQGLAASGIAVLFASLLAGVNLYHIIPISLGFALMALTTATAVSLSLRHGPFVALLGLVGGFMTPFWISTGVPRPWALFGYLLLLQIGLALVSRRRGWWPITLLALVGAVIWAGVWIALVVPGGGTTLPVGLFLLSTVAGVVGWSGRDDDRGPARMPQALVWSAVGAGVVLLTALVESARFGLVEWGFLAILGAGCLMLGRKDSRYEGLAWLAALGGAALLFHWGFVIDVGESLRYWSIAAALAALYVGGAYAVMWAHARPAGWAALSGVSGIVYLLAAFWAVSVAVPWGVQSLILAAIFGVLAWLSARGGRGRLPLAILATTATALVSLAVPMELERAWITVAWALEIPALAWISRRLDVRELEKPVWLLGGAVLVRLLANPQVLFYPTGPGFPFNWLLYGYGVPLVALLAAAWVFGRGGRTRLAEALGAGSIALGLALIVLQIRQYFHPGDLAALHFELAEWGALTVFGLLYALALFTVFERTGWRVTGIAARFVGLASLLLALCAQVFLGNPLFAARPVGTTLVFNRLLWVYGAPALLAVFLARKLRVQGLPAELRFSGAAGLILGFTLLTLEVRQAFHGGLLDRGPVSDAEMYAYSLAWVLFALALLVCGIVTRGAVLRYGSAAVMFLAVCKVFIVDAANLHDLYRVFSYFGLGLSLMLLAYLYQRFVFGERHGG